VTARNRKKEQKKEKGTKKRTKNKKRIMHTHKKPDGTEETYFANKLTLLLHKK